MTEWPDDRLAEALGALATELAVPSPAPIDTSAPDTGRIRRSLLVAAAAVAVVTAAVLALVAVPSARRTVADWFGWHGVRVERVERVERPAADPAGLPPFGDGIAALDVDAALAEAGVSDEALAAAGLGRPDAAGRPPEGGVVLAWDEGATSLWVRATGTDAEVLATKLLDASDDVRAVEGLGDEALVIDGPHVLETPARRVAADHVLWWVAGDVEHRLESDLPSDRLVAIARAL